MNKFGQRKAASSERTLKVLKNVFLIFHLVTFAIINFLIPEPYIDEIFHVSQAQAYCNGRFFEWNAKITTPPGL